MNPEELPVLELTPAELLAEHGIDTWPKRQLASKRETTWQDGRWVSLSRARLGPEE